MEHDITPETDNNAVPETAAAITMTVSKKQ